MSTRPPEPPSHARSDGQARLQDMFEQGYAPAGAGRGAERAARFDAGAAEQLLRSIQEDVSALRSMLVAARGEAEREARGS